MTAGPAGPPGPRGGSQSAAPTPGGRPILVASFNPGKARELVALLARSGRRATTLAEAGISTPYEETGRTYEENGLGKARHYARITGLVTIADDSGLEVEALGGAPGPLSARYGGPGLDDGDRNRALLAAMAGVPEAERAARYVAVAVVARPDGEARAFRGECVGRVLEAPRGSGGFGYDPLFFYAPYGASFAEVSDERKHAVSHRGAAFALLVDWLGSGEGERFTSGW